MGKSRKKVTSKYSVGDRVVYNGTTEEQVRWGGNTDPRGLLHEGNAYTIVKMDCHNWHTKLYLDGVDGKFNSVCFTKEDSP